MAGESSRRSNLVDVYVQSTSDASPPYRPLEHTSISMLSCLES